MSIFSKRNQWSPQIQAPPSIYWNSFTSLYRDLEKTFTYVHPNNDQLNVYSTKYYELLLRSCTEFESICKEYLIEKGKNGKKEKDKLTIKEYHLLNKEFDKNLSSCNVIFSFDETIELKPLETWSHSHRLLWYQQYNNVKHHRAKEFKKANLGNVLTSIGALAIILSKTRKIGKSQKSELVRINNKIEYGTAFDGISSLLIYES